MTSPPVTVTPEDSLQTALELLGRHNVRQLPVVDDGRLVGILTDRDLRQVSPSYPLFRDPEEIRYHLQRMKVGTAMTPDPMVVDPETPLLKAAELLYMYRFGALPVVEDGRVVGIISVTDLLKAFIEQKSSAA
jgi:acetoin utilization protein AcuB